MIWNWTRQCLQRCCEPSSKLSAVATAVLVLAGATAAHSEPLSSRPTRGAVDRSATTTSEPATSITGPDERSGRLSIDSIRKYSVNTELDDGVLKIDGSIFDDKVTVEVMKSSSRSPSSTKFRSGALKIQVTLRGTCIWKTALSDVESIEFSGRDGDDSFENLTSIPSFAEGGDGDDVLIGGSSADLLYGDDGDDEIDGGCGPDEIHGGDGSDVLSGGEQDDVIYGDGNSDTLHGDAGDDSLYGGSGGDSLYGDSGDDSLAGMKGDDGLFGGDGDDSLSGGQNEDRFLYQDDDTLVDFDRTCDARIEFIDDSGAMVYDSSAGGWVNYDAGTWTEENIEKVDEGLAVLHNLLGNTTFLKQDNGKDVTFYRIGLPNNASSGPPAWNIAFGSVHMSQLVFDGTTSDVIETVIHEMAHNWDLWDNPDWDAWKELSGWKWSLSGWDYTGSDDGFISGYSMSYPWEDWAEMFAFYIQFSIDESFAEDNAGLLDETSDDYNEVIDDKFRFIDDWVSTL